MNISLKQIETFVWVADLGSFRGAAERLNTTQPNISTRIASLENLLGVTLMDRDAGSVRLTPKGIELLSHARKVLRSMEEFVESVDEPKLYDGVLRLGVTEMIVHTWLRQFLKTFKERYPNTSIELTVDLSVNIEQELADHAIDLAFQSGPFSQRTSGNLSLGSFPMVWVASPSTELQLLNKVTYEELSKFSIITHARNTKLYEEMVAHVASHQGSKARIVPSSNISACVQMTIDGFGVAALLLPLVEKAIASEQLCVFNYEWQPERLDFYARYESDKCSNIAKRAAELAEEISNSFAQRYLA